MTDIPILFSAPMIRALLEGRKTMTRRTLYTRHKMRNGKLPARASFLQEYPPPQGGLGREGFPTGIAFGEYWALSSWHGVQVGDRLWVRESHRLTDCDCTEACRGAGHVWYDATEDGYRNVADNKLRPSIHMPRWASRITLIVTAVKIERLRDISEADAIAEGIALAFTDDECRTVVGLTGTTPSDHGWTNYLWHGHVGSGITRAQSDAWPHQFSTYKDPRGSFSSLWAKINGPASWDANPFVVATSFRVIKANIDAPEARIAA